MKPSTQKFFIDGSAGKLETVLVEPELSPRGIAVIAHPHPLFGGTMENKIVHTLFNAFVELDFISIKFNFRGVGESAGIYDNGVGEIEDVLSVTDFIRDHFTAQHGELDLLLAGFSFGGAIQSHVAQRLKPQHLILIAPSVERLNAPAVVDNAEKILVIHGDQDDVVPLQAVLDWAAPQSQPVIIVPSAGHFFHGRLTDIKQIVLNALKLV